MTGFNGPLLLLQHVVLERKLIGTGNSTPYPLVKGTTLDWGASDAP